MVGQWPGEEGGGKGRCIWQLWFTLGSLYVGHLRVTIGHLRVTIGHLSLTIGYPKATVVHIRVTVVHLRVTIGTL